MTDLGPGASVCLSYMDPVADRLCSAHVAAVGNRALYHLEMGILMGRISGQRGTLLLGDDDAGWAAKDPGTLFVKTVKTTSLDAAYDSTKFYEAWRTVIQGYGIYNPYTGGPYTGRNAIKGLLPHGPHNLRDILATHILKLTGSYYQASYAIQDTPDVVQQHYGRFWLPRY